MKLLIVLATFCAVALAEEPDTFQIDYGNCVWKYGSANSKVNCDAGYVATGACGNKGQTRCNNSAFGLECCFAPGLSRGDCSEKYGNKGDSVACNSGYQVYGTCGSLDMSRCSHAGSNRCITINCCQSNMQVDESRCEWMYGANQGEHLYCKRSAGNEQVLVGRCGSETMAQCNGSQVHGIRCCNLA